MSVDRTLHNWIKIPGGQQIQRSPLYKYKLKTINQTELPKFVAKCPTSLKLSKER